MINELFPEGEKGKFKAFRLTPLLSELHRKFDLRGGLLEETGEDLYWNYLVFFHGKFQKIEQYAKNLSDAKKIAKQLSFLNQKVFEIKSFRLMAKKELLEGIFSGRHNRNN